MLRLNRSNIRHLLLLFWTVTLFSCYEIKQETKISEIVEEQNISEVSLIVLGTVQDAGCPHIACKKACCAPPVANKNHKVVSLGIIDHGTNKKYLFDATPDMTEQLNVLNNHLDSVENLVDGVFLTHAHMGHYSGLMYFGREALGGNKIPVYAMPRMRSFLENNGPWDQLVSLKNIEINDLSADSTITLSEKLKVVPFLVPHRDEYSETVGFKILGPEKSAIFIPDIDKWNIWERDIIEEIEKVDYAFLDATFYDGAEVNHRPVEEIPHPFVIESMALFDTLESDVRNKIYFIHLNHTNPLLDTFSDSYRKVLGKGYHVAMEKSIFEL